jgi:hypothetical protein
MEASYRFQQRTSRYICRLSFIFGGLPAGRVCFLHPTLDVVRVIAAGLVDLDFDLAREFQQAMID